ncbi:glycosyltransferase family 25 protein [Mesorhizobium sp. M1B.F.Ca.ET.045.04.1.1]|uniref:glycosyltransferase family 25 protein n=1 Tax=Mesorhizobium sp. M1B.F.Ca.ET.045.04.1.1 TaxID=2493673 RepID=UPI000F752C3F|nr:glycosyltransferase family 25 protein [Mesorhizobium sp. M1B.F.Ca.ET.045.04.1.1]AZO29562.1 glycosyltransferase family 25 protein [Mesorhizobium sp. M1B.F.Ca.ET.045.04.1.1]
MRSFYINLAVSVDRRKWFDAQASRLGLDIERFDAVSNASIADSVATQFNVSKEAVACFFSHRAIWKEIASGPDRFAAIFEDDAHLGADLPAFLNDVSWIPVDADIVHLEKLGKRFVGVETGQRALGRKLYQALSGFAGTAAYIISRECAAKLHATFTEINQEFDQHLFNEGLPGLKVYKIGPALCIQDRFTAAPRFPSVIVRHERPKRLRAPGAALREAARIYKRLASIAVRSLGLRRPRLIAIKIK